MSERVAAAAKELNGYTGDCRCHEGYTSRRLIDPDCCYHEVPNHEVAIDMLKAADAVMFSDENEAWIAQIVASYGVEAPFACVAEIVAALREEA